MERMLATPADAEIILRLYELRTEAVMRQARAWMTGEFWPATAEEYFAVAENPPIHTMPGCGRCSPTGRWLRRWCCTGRFQRSCLWIAMARVFSCCQIWAHSGRDPGEESGVSDQDRGAGEPVFSGCPAL